MGRVSEPARVREPTEQERVAARLIEAGVIDDLIDEWCATRIGEDDSIRKKISARLGTFLEEAYALPRLAQRPFDSRWVYTLADLAIINRQAFRHERPVWEWIPVDRGTLADLPA